MNKILKKVVFIAVSSIMLLSLVACGSGSKEDIAGIENGKFPTFTAKGLDGKEYSDSLFKENAVTVANLWFTGCGACVQEMPTLAKLDKEWSAKNVKLIGICTDGGTTESDNEARKILEKNNAMYTNLVMNKGEAIDKFINSVMAFPTTLLIDREGNVVGDPIIGAIDTKEKIADLNKKIDDIIAKDKQQGGK
ncbi:Thiol-disulfide isomerase or thioredoxin [Peptoniphilus asaccharolyticus DSM 20463]|uniref:Thiol-disulfide isomerase or thioredoxin n=1 Tax=Peptoniphilus asaccharolyticus DSM 20463 TaxID=573058 RepID=A0A1W1V2Y7_PEPAS|nr:TlpA disulfide reductase family protein [Peptoniphilus asaccharolyticus]MBL7576171.1 TlpA family protein disulfide reductase [Peptoniphilus asaccharolyticus]CRH93871.1 Cytochrome c biogenesis protein tlpA [Chlamydia trachomatis]SMB87693.1 Thiol-disulfide isomerase or thioredoxin [Peptoniphilus asaccharolyticus DSM 20463]